MLAKIIGIGGVVLCIPIAIIGLANIDTYGIVVFISALISGLLCVVSSWPLYGFGELIERVTSIDNKLKFNPVMNYETDKNSRKENMDKIEDMEEEKVEDNTGLISSVVCGSYCTECGTMLTQEMIDSNMCYECGKILDDKLLE